MALMRFPSGNMYDVPDAEIALAEKDYGAYVDTGSPVLAYMFPSGKSYFVNPAEVPTATKDYGARQITAPFVDVEMPDTTVKHAPQAQLADYASQGAKILRPSTTIADIDKSKPANKTPVLWYGRSLNTPIEQLSGGKDYLDLANKSARGREGFWEGITPSAESIPFYIGGVMTMARLASLNQTARKLEDDIDPTDQELLDLNLYLLEQDREANASASGKVGSILRQSITYGIDLAVAGGAIGLLIKGGIKKGTAAAGEKALSRRLGTLVREHVAEAVEKSLGKSAQTIARAGGKASFAHYTGRAAGHLAGAGAMGASTAAVKQAVEGIASVAMDEGVSSAVAERRQLYGSLTGVPESEMKSYLLGTVENFIENFSEFTGEGLRGAARALTGELLPEAWAKIVGNKLREFTVKGVGPGVTSRVLEDTKKFAAGVRVVRDFWAKHMPASDKAETFFRNLGYDDVLEEWGEERVAGFMNGLFGTQGDSASLRNAWEQMWPTTEDGIAELMAFALPGLYVTGMRRLEASVRGEGFSSIGASGNMILRAVTPVPEKKPSRTEAGKFTIDGKILDTEQEDKQLDLAVDELAVRANTEDTFANKAVNLLFDIAVFPVTRDLTRIQFGSVDRYLQANNQASLVKWFQILQDNFGSEEQAKKGMKGLMKFMLRRTVAPSSNVALNEKLQALADSGAITREEMGIALAVDDTMALQKDVLKHLVDQGVRISVKVGTFAANKYTIDEAESVVWEKMLEPTTPPGERFAAALQLGYGRRGGFAELPVLSKGVGAVIDLKTRIPRAVKAFVSEDRVTPGRTITDLGSKAKKQYRVLSLTPDGKHAVVAPLSGGASSTVRVGAIRLPANTGKKFSHALDPLGVRLAPVIMPTVTGTRAEFEAHAALFSRYGGMAAFDSFATLTGKKINREPEYRVSIGALNSPGVIFINVLAGPWSGVEDLIEELAPEDIKDIPGAREFLDQLEKYITQRLNSKKGSISDDERKGLEELNKALGAGAERELLFKIIGMKLAKYGHADYADVERLPFDEAISWLPDNFHFLAGGTAQAHKIVAQYLGPSWDAQFKNPYVDMKLGFEGAPAKATSPTKMRNKSGPQVAPSAAPRAAAAAAPAAAPAPAATHQAEMSEANRESYQSWLKSIPDLAGLQVLKRDTENLKNNPFRDAQLEMIVDEIAARAAGAAAPLAVPGVEPSAGQQAPPVQSVQEQKKKRGPRKGNKVSKGAPAAEVKPTPAAEVKPTPAAEVKPADQRSGEVAGNKNIPNESSKPPSSDLGILRSSLLATSMDADKPVPVDEVYFPGLGDEPEQQSLLKALLELGGKSMIGESEPDFIKRVLEKHGVPRDRFNKAMEMLRTDEDLLERFRLLKDSIETQDLVPEIARLPDEDLKFLEERAKAAGELYPYMENPTDALAPGVPAVASPELLKKVISPGSLVNYAIQLRRKDRGAEESNDDPDDTGLDESEQELMDATVEELKVLFGDDAKIFEYFNVKTGLLAAAMDEIYAIKGHYGHRILMNFFSSPEVVDEIFAATGSLEAYDKFLNSPAITGLGFWLKSFFKVMRDTYKVSPAMLRGMTVAYSVMNPVQVIAYDTRGTALAFVPKPLQGDHSDKGLMKLLAAAGELDQRTYTLKQAIRRNVRFMAVPEGASAPKDSNVSYINRAMIDLSDGVLSEPGFDDSESLATMQLGRATPGISKKVFVRLSGDPLTPAARKELLKNMDDMAKGEGFEYFVVSDRPGSDSEILKYAASRNYKIISVYGTKGRTLVVNRASAYRDLQRTVEAHADSLSPEETYKIVQKLIARLRDIDEKHVGNVELRKEALAEALEALSGISQRAWLRLSDQRLLGKRGIQSNIKISEGLVARSIAPQEALGMLSPVAMSGRYIGVYLKQDDSNRAEKTKTEFMARMFFLGPAAMTRDGAFIEYGAPNLWYLGHVEGPNLAPMADIGEINGKPKTLPGAYIDNVALKAVKQWQAGMFRDAGVPEHPVSEDIISLGRIGFKGRNYTFELLPRKARMQVINDMWSRGFIYLGSFSDKSTAFFARVLPSTAEETYRWYRKMYDSADEDIKKRLVNIPELTKEQLKIKSSELFDLDHDFWVPIYLAKMTRLIDGNFEAYRSGKTDVVDNMMKRRTSDITGGPTFKYVVKARGGKPIKGIIVSDKVVSARMNGQTVYSNQFGADYHKAFGPLFIRDSLELPTGEKAAYSIKFHLKDVDKNGDPEYHKHAATIMEGLRGNEDALADSLEEIFNNTDIQFVQFGPENVKVTADESNWVSLFDDEGNLKGSLEDTVALVNKYAEELPADSMYVSTDLSRNMNIPYVGRTAKQATLLLSNFGDDSLPMFELLGAERIEAAAKLELSDPTWVIDHIIMRFADPSHPQHVLFKAFVEDKLPLDHPQYNVRLTRALTSHLAKQLQVRVEREIRQLVGGLSKEVTPYVMLDSDGNETEDINKAAFLQMPQIIATGKPTIAIDQNIMVHSPFTVVKNKKFIRVQTYGDGTWNSSDEGIKQFVADHAAYFPDMFLKAADLVKAKDANGDWLYVPQGFVNDEPVVQKGAPLIRVIKENEKYRVDPESVDARLFVRVKTENERELNGGQEKYIPGSLGRVTRIPSGNMGSSHIVRYRAAGCEQANFITQHDIITAAQGADRDGDQSMDDLPVGNKFDSSRNGRMNRMMFLEAELRSDPTLLSSILEPLDAATKRRTAPMQKIAQGKRGLMKFNSLETFPDAADINTAGIKDTLAIFAKSNTATAVVNGITPVVTQFEFAKDDVRNYLTFRYQGKEYEVGRSQKLADELKNRKNISLRITLQSTTTGVSVSVCIDDEKRPVLWFCGVVKKMVPYLIELLRFNASIIPDASLSRTEQLEQLVKNTDELWENMMLDLADETTYLGMFKKLITGEEYISPFDAWLTVALAKDATQSQRDEYATLKDAIESPGAQPITFKRYHKLVSEIINPAKSEAGRYIRLAGINSGMFDMGKFSDVLMASGLPASFGGFVGLNSKMMGLLANGTTGALRVDIPPALKSTVGTTMRSLATAYNSVNVTPVLPQLVDELNMKNPMMMKQKDLDALRDAYDQALYSEAVATLELGTGVLDPRTRGPVPIFTQKTVSPETGELTGMDGLLSLVHGVTENSRIRKYFTIYEGRDGQRKLRLSPLMATGEAGEMEQQLLIEELSKLDDAVIADLYKLDAATYNVHSTPFSGSFKEFLGSKANHRVRDMIIANLQVVRERHKSQGLPKEVVTRITDAVLSGKPFVLKKYPIADEAKSGKIRATAERIAQEDEYGEPMEDTSLGSAADYDEASEEDIFEGASRRAGVRDLGDIPGRESLIPLRIGPEDAEAAGVQVTSRYHPFDDPGKIAGQFSYEPVRPRYPEETEALRVTMDTMSSIEYLETIGTSGKTVYLGPRYTDGSVTLSGDPVARIAYPVEGMGTIMREKRDKHRQLVTVNPIRETDKFSWNDVRRILKAAAKHIDNPNMFDDMPAADAIRLALKTVYPAYYTWLSKEPETVSRIKKFGALRFRPPAVKPAPVEQKPAAPQPEKTVLKSFSDLSLNASIIQTWDPTKQARLDELELLEADNGLPTTALVTEMENLRNQRTKYYEAEAAKGTFKPIGYVGREDRERIVPLANEVYDPYDTTGAPPHTSSKEAQVAADQETSKLAVPISPILPGSAYGSDLKKLDLGEINASLLMLPARMAEWAGTSIQNYGIEHAHKFYIDMITRFSELETREIELLNDDINALATMGDMKIKAAKDPSKTVETLTENEQTLLMMYPWVFGAILDARRTGVVGKERGQTIVDMVVEARNKRLRAIRKTVPAARQAEAVAEENKIAKQRLEKFFGKIEIPFGRDITLTGYNADGSNLVIPNNITVADFLKILTKSSAWTKLSKHRAPVQIDWFEHVLKNYNFYKQIAADFPSIIHRNPVFGIPHIYGPGFKDMWHQRAMDQIALALGNIKRVDPMDTLLTAEELSHNDKGEPPKPTRRQKELLSSLQPNYTRYYRNGVLDNLTMWDFNDMIIHALMHHQVELAEASLRTGSGSYNPEDPANRKALATINALNNAMQHYKHKEWSRHELGRTLYGSMSDINKSAKVVSVLPNGKTVSYSLKPATMDTVRLRRSYLSSLMPVILNRTVLSHYLSMLDYDGQPFILLELSGLEDVKSLINENVLRKQVENWYHINHPGKKLPANADLNAEIQKIKGTLNLKDYEVMESPFVSISKIYVKKGDAADLMKHLIQEEKKISVLGVDVAAWWNGFTQWSKLSSVAYSLFFLTSNLESVIAGTSLVGNIMMHPIRTLRECLALAEELRDPSPHSLVRKFRNMCIRAGVELGKEASLDQASSTIQRHIEYVREKSRLHFGEKFAKGMETALEIYAGKYLSEVYFGRSGRRVGIFPTLKLWAIKHAADVAVKSFDPSLSWDQLDEATQTKILQRLATPINDAYGGQLWAKYLWATPRMRQLLNATLFAPNWTISAWNIAGGGALSGQLLGNQMGQPTADFVVRNSLAMVAYVLFLLPNVIQFLIWAAFGSGDDGDEPFTFLNEENRKSYIDVTPVARLFGYDGDPTGKRRIYVRFGKQAYEVYQGWLTEPLNQFARKLSQPAKVVIEQVTGKSPGSDWNLEFQGQGLKGWLDSSDESLARSFINSRVGYVLQKVFPMSVSQFLKDPHLGVAPFIAPVSKGTSQGKATADLILLYRSLAEDNNWKEFHKFPEAMANLDGIGQEILDGAALNGYDTSLIVKTAKGVVLADLYKRFAEAMNNLDTDRMNSLADRIIRVGGSLKGLKTSQALKKRGAGQTVSEEEALMMEQALANPFEAPEPGANLSTKWVPGSL